MIINQLPESVTLQYAELLQQAWSSLPSGRGISFVKKTNKGKDYWYIQSTVGSKKSQHYLGPDSDEIRQKIQQEKRLWQNAIPELEQRKRLVAMLLAGGAQSIDSAHSRVLELLERSGVFLAGGVIVGSHAFTLYANMLGVVWDMGSTRTQDIDVAVDNSLKIGLGKKTVDLRHAILESGMGFFEVPALSRKHASTSFSVKGKQLRVDVLTPMIGKPSSNPVLLKSINAMAEPIRFLDFLLDDIQPAIVLSKAGIYVNVPSPARYAIHKLVVSQRRPATIHVKAKKDIRQAQQLFDVLIDERPGDLALAFEEVKKQPNKFLTQLETGLSLLPDSIGEKLKTYL